MCEEQKAKTYPAQEIFDLGQAALEKGDPQRAFEHFQKAAEKDHPQAHYCLAKLYDQNIMQVDESGLEGRLSIAKEHLRRAVILGFAPKKAITFLNKINDCILQEILKKTLKQHFKTQDVKSFNSILTFLKVDDKTRHDFNETYLHKDNARFEALLKAL